MPIDAASHGLGLTVLNEQSAELINLVIIKAGSSLPANGSASLTTTVEGQTQVELQLNEGDEENLQYVRVLGVQQGEFSAPRAAGYPLEARISYDLDQLIIAEIFDAQTGARLCSLKVRSDGGMTDSQKAISTQSMQGLEIR